MVSEAEIKARIERETEEAYRQPGGPNLSNVVEFFVRALVKEEDARRRSDADFTEAARERDRVVLSLKETTASLRAQTRARQEAESAAAHAQHEARFFEAAALKSEKERTEVEARLRAEIAELRKTVALFRAAHVANLRVHLATVEGQS